MTVKSYNNLKERAANYLTGLDNWFVIKPIVRSENDLLKAIMERDKRIAKLEYILKCFISRSDHIPSSTLVCLDEARDLFRRDFERWLAEFDNDCSS